MSAPHHDNGHGHAHGHDDTAPAHGSRREYMIGFVLSVILTAVPFALVMTGVIADARVTAGLVMVAALIQIVVHMVYFLHMNTKSENGWTLMALVFTAVLVVIALSGSLWVMYHMNINMMPQMDGTAGGSEMGGM